MFLIRIILGFLGSARISVSITKTVDSGGYQAGNTPDSPLKIPLSGTAQHF